MSTVLLSLNAFDRTISYKGSLRTINDDYWEREISPILVPMWDSPKDRLELFYYKEDNTFLVQRNKYIKNFKTGDSKWISYEFDPAAIPEYSVSDLFEKLKEKFITYKDISESEYEMMIQRKFMESASLNWDKVKLVRKFLLDESDWTQTEDSPISGEEKELWKQYRSYLRELFNANQVENPYDVTFPITPKEYLKRKELEDQISPITKEALGDQGINTEYLFSEWHFWRLTANAVNSFAKKMTIYMTMRSILDESSALKGIKPVRPFRTETILVGREKANSEIIAANPNKDPDVFINALLTRIENGEI